MSERTIGLTVIGTLLLTCSGYSCLLGAWLGYLVRR